MAVVRLKKWKIVLFFAGFLPPLVLLTGIEVIARRKAREFEQAQQARLRRVEGALRKRTPLRGPSTPGNAWDVYLPISIRMDAVPQAEKRSLSLVLHGSLPAGPTGGPPSSVSGKSAPPPVILPTAADAASAAGLVVRFGADLTRLKSAARFEEAYLGPGRMTTDWWVCSAGASLAMELLFHEAQLHLAAGRTTEALESVATALQFALDIAGAPTCFSPQHLGWFFHSHIRTLLRLIADPAASEAFLHPMATLVAAVENSLPDADMILDGFVIHLLGRTADERMFTFSGEFQEYWPALFSPRIAKAHWSERIARLPKPSELAVMNHMDAWSRYVTLDESWRVRHGRAVFRCFGATKEVDDDRRIFTAELRVIRAAALLRLGIVPGHPEWPDPPEPGHPVQALRGTGFWTVQADRTMGSPIRGELPESLVPVR